MQINLDKAAESTFMRFTSRVAIMAVPPLLLLVVWFVQHEIGVLETSHAEEVRQRETGSKSMWEQVGKITQMQNDTVSKLMQVTTSFADHSKDDDKFEASVGKSLDNIAQQIRDISVSGVRVAPAAPASTEIPLRAPKH